MPALHMEAEELRIERTAVVERMNQLRAHLNEIISKHDQAIADYEQRNPGVRARLATSATTGDLEADRSPKVTVEARADGTLSLLGDADAIRKTLVAAGITKFIPMRGGICVGLTQVEQARALFTEKPTEKRLVRHKK